MNRGEKLRSYLDRAVSAPGETACSQPCFPMTHCTCTVCRAIQRSRQEMVLLVENPSQELLGLYNRLFVPQH